MPDPTLLTKSRSAFTQPTVRSKMGLGILTLVAFIFFAAVALVYGGVYFYQRTLTDNLEGLTLELSDLEKKFDPEQIKEIAQVDHALVLARDFLSKHVHSSRVLELIEANTLKRIRYNELKFSTDGKSLTLKGKADGYVTLNDQINHFGTVSEITGVKFNSVTVDADGFVGFALDLFLDGNILRFKP